MRSARGIATLALAVATATGCTDTTKPAVSVNEPAIAPPQTSAQSTSIGPQSPPPGASGEWLAATSIMVEAYAGFREDRVNPDEGVPGNARAFAWGQSIVRYYANEADARVTLTTKKNGAVAGVEQDTRSDRFWFPANRSVSAITQLAVPALCGYTAEAKASGEAWNRVIIPPVGWMEWGRKADGDARAAYQSPCENGAPPSGGDGPVTVPDANRANCAWHRDFIVFADGSWRWLTGWYQSCHEDELSIARGGPTDITQTTASRLAAKSANSAPVRVTLVSATKVGAGPIATIERNGKGNVDAVITIDLTRATAADLEEAFVAAEALSLKVKPKDLRSAYGRVVSGSSAASRAAAGVGSRAAKALDALLAAGEGKSGGHTQIDIVVNHK